MIVASSGSIGIMVNMNKFKEPAVYALTHEGQVFYVGYTSSNALTRHWEHISRAQNGHQSPVYRHMRDIGVRNVSYKILQKITPLEDGKVEEARWIKSFVDSGIPLTNVLARDGNPDSLSPEMRSTMGASRKGKSTWIKGRTGEDAGWTEERRRKMAERAAIRRANTPPPPPREAKERPTPAYKIHGTAACYKHGKCRCEECSRANREYVRRFYPSNKEQ